MFFMPEILISIISCKYSSLCNRFYLFWTFFYLFKKGSSVSVLCLVSNICDWLQFAVDHSVNGAVISSNPIGAYMHKDKSLKSNNLLIGLLILYRNLLVSVSLQIIFQNLLSHALFGAVYRCRFIFSCVSS